MWLLLILVVLGQTTGIQPVEYTTQAACERARDAIINESGRRIKMSGGLVVMCVRKE